MPVRATPLAREAVLCAAAAAFLASLLVWLGPPGADFAAHAYQRTAFLQHGFALWNNFWYAGRYSFITYSVIYYPLAALIGIKLLAVATVATAALAFTVVLRHEWGAAARWSSWTFAVVWSCIVVSGAFPFALGAALALLSIWALQTGSRWKFGALAALTLAASPLAFLLLSFVLTGIGVARWREGRKFLVPAAIIVAMGATEAVLWRLFADGGRYPFSWQELLAVCVFCILGAALTWRVEGARPLRWLFIVYLGACLAAFAIPSSLGENVDRLRYVAVPVAVLALSLRQWRPLPVAVVTLALAASWNLTPLAFSFVKTSEDPASAEGYWRPAISYLHQHLSKSYRVEAVDTAGHWDAVYLPRAGIPLARGWFRQNDYPQNRLLYSDDGFGRSAYLRWLRSLGVRYVVLTDAPPDYSARDEALLLRSGKSGLTRVMRTSDVSIYAVPSPRPLITGPGPASVVGLTESQVTVRAAEAGTYRLAIRYSPYWMASTGCLDPGQDSMIRLRIPAPGTVKLSIHVNARRALDAFAGQSPQTCTN
ncbi:MAG: transposase [Actinobacteria bacterium]|nr:MAG: transposase [Actinomycetota bacterium]